MPTTALSSLPFLLQALVDVCMLVGIGLILFRPFFPGLLVILAGLAVYVGYFSFTAHTLAGITPVGLALVAVTAAVALSSTWWSDKLGLRFTYTDSMVMWGAFVGSFVGMYLWNIFGLLIGLVIGAFAMELRGGKRLPDALRQGMASMLSMLGPRGFQLIMAILASQLALTHLSR
jgi:uncharacterized protein YqgC (DUF456 family)